MPTAISEFDGKEVDTASPEWRFECEVRHVLSMPNREARLAFIDGVRVGDKWEPKGIRQQRGDAAAEQLKSGVLRLYQIRQEKKNAGT